MLQLRRHSQVNKYFLNVISIFLYQIYIYNFNKIPLKWLLLSNSLLIGILLFSFLHCKKKISVIFVYIYLYGWRDCKYFFMLMWNSPCLKHTHIVCGFNTHTHTHTHTHTVDWQQRGQENEGTSLSGPRVRSYFHRPQRSKRFINSNLIYL